MNVTPDSIEGRKLLPSLARSSCRTHVVWVTMGDLPGFLRRITPSDNDLATSWKETVRMEDKLRNDFLKKEGIIAGASLARQPPPRPPLRGELLSFATGQGRADWKAALADPEAEEAMRKIRARVKGLLSEGRAIMEFRAVAPEDGSKLINAQKKGPRHSAFRTSEFNPVYNDPLEEGWDPNARRWTGRRGMVGLDTEPTSLWCASWGGCANDKGLDTDFKHTLQKQTAVGVPPAPPQDLSMHTRGWR